MWFVRFYIVCVSLLCDGCKHVGCGGSVLRLRLTISRICDGISRSFLMWKSFQRAFCKHEAGFWSKIFEGIFAHQKKVQHSSKKSHKFQSYPVESSQDITSQAIPPTPSPITPVKTFDLSRPIQVHMYASRSASTCDIFHFVFDFLNLQQRKKQDEGGRRRRKKLSSLLNQLFWGTSIFTTGCVAPESFKYDVLEFR